VTPVLRLSNVTKRFGTLLANDGISLDLAAGEVLALLGENGAGKSTLVSILFGHYVADAGTVEVFGKRLPPGDTRAALAAGVGMVHQHFTLAENLTVLENAMLGLEPLWRPASRREAMKDRLLQAGAAYGLQVDPAARVSSLSVGERQRVEILKALVRGARILVLDEPTSVLTPQESESLFATLERFTRSGLALIFISHKLDEVLRVSHRVLVLKHGRTVLQTPTAAATKASLAEAMIGSLAPAGMAGGSGQAALAGDASADGTSAGDAPLVELEHVSVAKAGHVGLHDIGLAVRPGEIVAIAGVAGNGQHTLAGLLGGGLSPQQGEVRVFGKALPPGARHWIDAGIARIPEDRIETGVIGDASLADNAVAHRLRDPQVLKGGRLARHLGLLDRGRNRAEARRIVAGFDVRHASLEQPIRMLSGGNIQKFIVGRELGREPAVIIANQPTWGLDIGAVAFVHRQLLQARRRGAAVLLVSEDLEEIFAIADRIAVMFGGRLSAALPAGQWDAAGIGLAMAGGSAP
jgi:simple sugar transport system ATP-binding protein